MSQTTYNQDFDVAFAGMPVDAEGVEYAETKLALESLDYGKAAMKADVTTTYPNGVRMPKRNQAAAVFSADLVTSNSVAATVNGVALTATVFATDHATTMAALGAKIVAALLALPTPIVATATVGGASNRTLTIDAKDAHVLLASFVVTLGGSQATVTLTNLTSDLAAQFLGILRHSSQPPRTSDGLNGYAANDAVAVVRQGRIWVPISANVSEGDAAYIDFTAAGGEGKFTNVTTAPNVGPVGVFRADAVTTGLGLAKLEVNLP
jgi:hypothetical protein